MTAAVFTIIGGAMYLFGSVLGTIIFGEILFGLLFGLSTASIGSTLGGGSFDSTGFGTAVSAILGFGWERALIIVGGALLNSESAQRRKSGGILAIAMMVIRAIPALGGFISGFIFVGSVLGLTYKPKSPYIVVGVATIGSDQRGAQ